MARQTLDKNVKFKALVQRLRLPRPYVRGLLETMWDVAHECGNPVLGSAEDVECAAEWPGKAGVFFEAVKSQRLIDELEGGRWEIHDYWHHAPDYVKGRKRKEEERRRKGSKADQSSGSSTRQNDCISDSSNSNGLGAKSPGQSRINPQKSATPAPAPAPLEDTYVSSPADADTAGEQARSEVRDDEPSAEPKPQRKRRAKVKGDANPDISALIAHFYAGYQQLYGCKPTLPEGKTGAHARWILSRFDDDLGEAKRLVDAFLADDEAWLLEQRHPFGLLRSRFDRYRIPLPAVAGKRHTLEDDFDPPAEFTPELRELAFRRGDE